MAPPPLLFVRDASVTFGGKPLFEGISAAVSPGDRTCLVGRNGSGKSTLLKVMAGLIDLDEGERFCQPGIRVAYLPQDPAPEPGRLVQDYVAEGLAGPDETHRVDAMLAALRLEGGRDLGTLSGGEMRRAALARTLVGGPDVLLMDEPTNHLDLPTIEWLEGELARYPGALVVISHDRAFLRRVSNRMLWLDRGVMRNREDGFALFDQWAEEVAAEEEAELNRMNVKLAEETHWLARGVTARRKRNMGRLRALKDLRAKRAEAMRDRPGSVRMTVEAGAASGKMVIEAEHLSKRYGDTVICEDFSTRILRGDRVGLIGPNGAGKTTLLRLLTGELEPDSGEVRLGTNLTPAYFDQHRAQLDPEATLWETLCPTGGDQVMVQDRPRHVVGYLRDFLFDERQARQPVKALSGGERNRLLLARILAKPSNLLILDEPTNDLDMDTLDLLQEMLTEYAGTLLLVSHDRDFLDRLVTSLIAVEGAGNVAEYVGGYEDYRRQRPAGDTAATDRDKPREQKAAKPEKRQTKLSYKDARELDRLPARMEELKEKVHDLETVLADPGLYSQDPAAFDKATTALARARAELDAAEERWLELELLKEELAEG